MNTAFQQPVVILAHGTFPTHPKPLAILANAGTVICTDGSADALIKRNLMPHILIGDGDSTKLNKHSFSGLWIDAPDQNKTDLQKTLEWCLINDINDVIVLGAMGIREDHALGNLYLLAGFSKKMRICFVTNHATIYSFRGKKQFPSASGQQVSIVATESVASITTTGLKYPLDAVQLLPSCNGISNEATGKKVTIDSSHSIWLFINHQE